MIKRVCDKHNFLNVSIRNYTKAYQYSFEFSFGCKRRTVTRSRIYALRDIPSESYYPIINNKGIIQLKELDEFNV